MQRDLALLRIFLPSHFSAITWSPNGLELFFVSNGFLLTLADPPNTPRSSTVDSSLSAWIREKSASMNSEVSEAHEETRITNVLIIFIKKNLCKISQDINIRL